MFRFNSGKIDDDLWSFRCSPEICREKDEEREEPLVEHSSDRNRASLFNVSSRGNGPEETVWKETADSFRAGVSVVEDLACRKIVS